MRIVDTSTGRVLFDSAGSKASLLIARVLVALGGAGLAGGVGGLVVYLGWKRIASQWAREAQQEAQKTSSNTPDSMNSTSSDESLRVKPSRDTPLAWAVRRVAEVLSGPVAVLKRFQVVSGSALIGMGMYIALLPYLLARNPPTVFISEVRSPVPASRV